MKFRLLTVFLFIPIMSFIGAATESDAEEAGSSETPTPEARPRLFDRTEMHPYRDTGRGYFDPWYYRGSPYSQYAYTRYGRRSYLYYDTFYGYLPEPGHSELSVSIGSDDYFGTSISTSGYLDKKLGITYNISALWESGETCWSQRDYDSFTIAPSFFWSNENTAVYVGFEYTETRFEGDGLSPFRAEAQNVDELDNSSHFRSIWVREPSDHTLKRATIGLEHQLTDFLSFGFHFDTTDIKSNR